MAIPFTNLAFNFGCAAIQNHVAMLPLHCLVKLLCVKHINDVEDVNSDQN